MNKDEQGYIDLTKMDPAVASVLSQGTAPAE